MPLPLVIRSRVNLRYKLTKTYKHYAVNLHTTGDCVQEDGDCDGSDSEEYCTVMSVTF
ncbi:hypothetical protein ID866_8160 [Astraeus odoratus]|nr:hypothetical protein ID866_8160 [Astraeus odoratus]